MPDPDDIDHVPSIKIFSFKKAPIAAADAREKRLEQRRVKQEKDEEKKRKAEQECQEMEQLELEAAHALLMINVPIMASV